MGRGTSDEYDAVGNHAMDCHAGSVCIAVGVCAPLIAQAVRSGWVGAEISDYQSALITARLEMHTSD